MEEVVFFFSFIIIFLMKQVGLPRFTQKKNTVPVLWQSLQRSADSEIEKE